MSGAFAILMGRVVELVELGQGAGHLRSDVRGVELEHRYQVVTTGTDCYQ